MAEQIEVQTDDASVVVSGDSESGAVTVVVPESETDSVSELGNGEIVSEAIAIEAIRSETAVELAEIAAETERARIEAERENETSWQEEVRELRENMTELNRQLTERLETVTQSLAQVLTPQALTEAEPEMLGVEIETVEEQNSIPEFTPEPTSEMETEVGPASEEGEPGAILEPPARKRRRLI